VQIGQIISSGISNVGGGTTTMILSDLSRIFVLASVDESDIGRVQVGQSAIITADAFPGKEFEGRVLRIATQGVNLNNVVTFEVKIEVIGKNKSLLKPEMTTNVIIIIEQKDDVLLIPSEAVLRKAGGYVAEVMKDGVKEERKVRGGINDLTMLEIVDGLSEGEVVVIRKDTSENRWSGRSQSSQRSSPLLGPSRRGPH
jgi:multidrug efflux pump subunit AcrA (membrane-fusion protein)